MTVKERLIEFINTQNISQSEFCRVIGEQRTFVSSMRDSTSSEKLHKIFVQYPMLNFTWLILGEGDMLIKEADDAVKSDENVQVWKERALLAEERVRNLESVIKTLQMVVEAEALKKMKKYSEEEQEDANGAESVENIAG